MKDHRREAERLAQLALDQWVKGECNLATDITMPQAQIHATLALAAAQPSSITDDDIMRCAHGAIICGLCGYGVPAGDGGRS